MQRVMDRLRCDVISAVGMLELLWLCNTLKQRLGKKKRWLKLQKS